MLLSATTAVPDVLAALERLRAPRLLVLIAAGMYRYLFVVAGEVSRTRAALAARAYRPRNALQAAAIGRAAGALFLRSYARGERVHVAMLARGYRGTVPRLRQLALRRADAVFLGLLAACARAGAGRGGDGPVSCAIHARDLRFRYADGTAALAGVDLDVEHGERVAVLGPNGAGKTTLMLHLNGLLKGEGRLEVAGLRVGSDDAGELRARVGLVFQDPDDQLFMPSVEEDVAFGPLNLGCSRAEAQARTAAALAAVGMEGVAARAPHQLSLGQRRRVAIATVLAMRARAARARRAVGEPRPAGAPRAAGGARRARADVARGHARPAVRGGAVRARADPVRRDAASPTAPAASCSRTRRCSNSTRSSCPRASLSTGFAA